MRYAPYAALLAVRGHWRILVPLAALANVPQSALVCKGPQTTTAVNVGLLNSSVTIVILLLGALFFARNVSWREATGILLSLSGVLVVLFEGSTARLLGLALNSGDLFAFGGMLTWAVYTLLLPRRPAMSLRAFVACMSAIGVTLCAPAVLAEILLDRAPSIDGQTSLVLAGALLAIRFPRLL